MDQLQQKQEEILGILRDPTLTHEQTVMTLAKAAENLLATPGAPEEYYKLKEAGIICDLFEGNAPYSPRYILPDYEKFFREGSQFLRLAPPTTLLEAITNLLILYHHVPSVTHFPVYIGRIDRLLEPFIEDEASAKPLIKHFLMQIDRTVTDSFCHGDIGPEATRAGRIILECERELQDSTPNITLLYDPKITPDDFALQCVEAALDCAKPSFANHRMFLSEFGEDYGIASCYNGLPVGGGAYTLTRLVLGKLAETAGRVGMNECGNTLMALEGKPDRFGHSEAADALGVEIMEAIDALVKAHKNPYCEFWNGSFILHAQVGIAQDQGVSPGTRIAIGEEIPLYDHLRQAGLFHKYFPSGTGDIFPFDATSARNPAAVLDVIKGAFQVGIRYFSTYSSDSDVIRITGYLVKKSDIEKLEQNQQVVNDTVFLGMGAKHNGHILDRKVRSL